VATSAGVLALVGATVALVLQRRRAAQTRAQAQTAAGRWLPTLRRR
jgi:hypothetical protein